MKYPRPRMLLAATEDDAHNPIKKSFGLNLFWPSILECDLKFRDGGFEFSEEECVGLLKRMCLINLCFLHDVVLVAVFVYLNRG